MTRLGDAPLQAVAGLCLIGPRCNTTRNETNRAHPLHPSVLRRPNGQVEVWPLKISQHTPYDMNRHREYKKERSKSMSNDRIDHWYQLAMANGVRGSKLIDAGGGGCLMFLCQERARAARADR